MPRRRALSIRQVTGAAAQIRGHGGEVRRARAFHPTVRIPILDGRRAVVHRKKPKSHDKKQAVRDARKLIDNEFTLDDFRDQIRQFKKVGRSSRCCP